MKCFIITLIIGLTLISSDSFAEGRGVLANESVGARSSVLGVSYIAIADDASALRWNPAGIASLLQTEFTASHTSIFSLGDFFDYSTSSESINQDFLGLVMPSRKIPFGVSIFSLNTYMPYTDDRGAPLGSKSYSENLFTLSFAKKLQSGNWGISPGLNTNLLYVNGGKNYSSLGLDAGILLNTPGLLPETGLVFKEIGWGAPVKLDFALSFNPIRPFHLASGISKVLDSSTLQYSTGAEYLIRFLAPINISFLIGYRGLGGIEIDSIEARTKGASAGVSVRIGRYKVDYAFDRNNILGNSHKLTFGAFMDSPEGFHLKAGKYAYEDLNDDKVLQEVKEILYLSPRNAEAYHLMALSYERMRDKTKSIAILEKIGKMNKGYYRKNNLEQLIQDIKEQD